MRNAALEVYSNNFDRFHLLMFVQSCLGPEGQLWYAHKTSWNLNKAVLISKFD